MTASASTPTGSDFRSALQGLLAPPRLLWLMPWLIMATVAAALAWSFVGELDIVVPAQGTLVPSGRVKVIQAPEPRIVRRTDRGAWLR